MPETAPDTANMVLKALEYGVLGLCAITLVFVAAIIRAEQARDGYPRKGIVTMSIAFMAFSLALAGINAYVQLQERTADGAEAAALRTQLEARGADVAAAEKRMSEYRETLAGLDGLIDLKVMDELTNQNTSPALRALAMQLKNTMDAAREKGLIEN